MVDIPIFPIFSLAVTYGADAFNYFFSLIFYFGIIGISENLILEMFRNG